MSMSLRTLRNAAFWSSWICLECGTELIEYTAQCPSCGSPQTRPAPLILEVYESLRESEDEEGGP